MRLERYGRKLSDNTILSLQEIAMDFFNFYIFCLNKAGVSYYIDDRKYDNIQFEGIESDRYDFPNMISNIEFFVDDFYNDLLKAREKNDNNVRLLLNEYYTAIYKYVFCCFYSKYSSSFCSHNHNQFLKNEEKIYLCENVIDEHKFDLKINFSPVEYKYLDFPGAYGKFLDVDVKEIDLYNSYKYSIEMYAKEVASQLESNITAIIEYLNEMNDIDYKMISNDYNIQCLSYEIASLMIRHIFSNIEEKTKEIKNIELNCEKIREYSNNEGYVSYECLK